VLVSLCYVSLRWLLEFVALRPQTPRAHPHLVRRHAHRHPSLRWKDNRPVCYRVVA
jgi:hypothetical protein